MSMRYNPEDFTRVRTKVRDVVAKLKPDLEYVGAAVSEAIVQTTLAGIGEDDKPFAPYSVSYKEQIDSVGGKPRQVVDLRGLFYHDGQKKYRGKKDLGQGRRGKIKPTFVAVPFDPLRPDRPYSSTDLVSFSAQTKETRPQRGLVDPNSEMSLDLLKPVATNDGSLEIRYTPRAKDYMIRHNDGDAAMPRRRWLTLKKAAVMDALREATQTVFAARVAWASDRSRSADSIPLPPQRRKPA